MSLQVELLGCVLHAFSTWTRSCQVVGPVSTPTSRVCAPLFPHPHQALVLWGINPLYAVRVCSCGDGFHLGRVAVNWLTFANLLYIEWHFCFNLHSDFKCYWASFYIVYWSLVICLFMSFVHCSVELFFYYFVNILYIFWILTLAGYMHCRYFLLVCGLFLNVICGIFLSCNNFYFKIAILISLFLYEFCFLSF